LKEVQEGDPKYLAPEILISYNNITCASDVFSLGMTILELATDLDLPRQGQLWHQLRLGQIPKEFTNNLSEELVKIIMLMIEPDHLKRATVNQLFMISSIQKRTKSEQTKKIFANAFNRIKSILFKTYQLTMSIFYFLVNPFVKLNKYVKEKMYKHDIEDQSLNMLNCIKTMNNEMNVENDQNMEITESASISTPKKTTISNVKSNLLKDITPNRNSQGNINRNFCCCCCCCLNRSKKR
jgi:serine/threonine protein kinase